MKFDLIWAKKERLLRDAMIHGGASDQQIETKLASVRKLHDEMVERTLKAQKNSVALLTEMARKRTAMMVEDKKAADARRAKKNVNIPTIIALFLMSFLLVGCSGIRKGYLADDVQQVNQIAFQGKVDASVKYCDRYRDDDSCWEHHGLYVPLTHEIHIAPEWYWEPHVYHLGVVAHEMIHAWLDQSNQEENQRTCHSWLFRQERDRVARALRIPVWAIPDGRREDKLDATRHMAYLERYMQYQINAVHGCSWDIHSDVGWPTQLYDADE